eukprot:TRINITY_DN3199_c0_g1_i10.p1 TRINITY_DN3199_c0_g1~~TRINITY_DN3199_c0_g1_i10.p1  ORF type:complete len:373 (-),score=47.98 TRINITY_DN3199_c0_g1_i10:56-1174(-)
MLQQLTPEILQFGTSVFSFLAAHKAVAVPAVAVAAGYRTGAEAALMLALRSRFVTLGTKSSRPEVRVLHARIYALRSRRVSSENYMVLMGQKGVGKTCALDTVLHRTCGVVRITVSPGTAADDIVANCHRAIAQGRTGQRWINYAGAAARTRWFYQLVFRQQPVIILGVSEITLRHPSYAEVAPATRRLAKEGYTVVIDSSPNSVDISVIQTNRQWELYMRQLSWQTVLEFPEFVSAREFLQKHNLEHAAQAVLGGNLAKITLLKDIIATTQSPETVVDFLKDHIRSGVVLFGRNVKEPGVKEFLMRFRDSDEVISATPPFEEGSVKPVSQAEPGTYIPSSPVILLIVRHISQEHWGGPALRNQIETLVGLK